MDAIRVLIADDHPIVREGLRTLLASELGMEIVGEATNGLAAVEQTLALEPDIVIMGTLARSGLPGFLIGNTAETVLSKISCSVLLNNVSPRCRGASSGSTLTGRHRRREHPHC